LGADQYRLLRLLRSQLLLFLFCTFSRTLLRPMSSYSSGYRQLCHLALILFSFRTSPVSFLGNLHLYSGHRQLSFVVRVKLALQTLICPSLWPTSTCSWAIVRTSSQILVCSTRTTVSSTQTIVFFSSGLFSFLFKPLLGNSSGICQFSIRTKVRPPLKPSPALPKAHSSSHRQFLLGGIVSSLLVPSSVFFRAIVIGLRVLAMVPLE